MITNEEYKNALYIVKLYRQQCVDTIIEIDKSDYDNKWYTIRNKLISDTDLSVRAMNVLFFGGFGLNQFDSLVKDLSLISRSELIRTRNLGKKSLGEIDLLLKEANVLMKP
jgi:DNA-directed RNA polymerase alpha subunit